MTKQAQLFGAREVIVTRRRSLEHSYAKGEIRRLTNKELLNLLNM